MMRWFRALLPFNRSAVLNPTTLILLFLYAYQQILSVYHGIVLLEVTKVYHLSFLVSSSFWVLLYIMTMPLFLLSGSFIRKVGTLKSVISIVICNIIGLLLFSTSESFFLLCLSRILLSGAFSLTVTMLLYVIDQSAADKFFGSILGGILSVGFLASGFSDIIFPGFLKILGWRLLGYSLCFIGVLIVGVIFIWRKKISCEISSYSRIFYFIGNDINS